jgi:hypothetical protein
LAPLGRFAVVLGDTLDALEMPVLMGFWYGEVFGGRLPWRL